MTMPNEHLPHQAPETGENTHRDALHEATSVIPTAAPETSNTEDNEPQSARLADAHLKLQQATENTEKTNEQNETSEPAILEKAYANFQQREAAEADPNDTLVNIRISPDAVEYQTLINTGVDPGQIDRGEVTRQQLLDAGYLFINRLGGGEKGLISGEIPDPNEPDKAHNLTKRTLLTHHEVAMVYQYQQDHADTFGLQGHNVDDVRKDMMSFMGAANYLPPFGNAYEFSQLALPHDVEYGEPGTEQAEPEDWEAVNHYWDDHVKTYQQANPGTDYFPALLAVKEAFTKDHCADLYDWDNQPQRDHLDTRIVRGRVIRTEADRSAKMNNQLSPFLTNGFRFDDRTIDLNVGIASEHAEQPTQQLRLNTAVFHLAGAHPDFPGLSEMGGVDRDQVYMPIGLYVNTLYPQDPNERRQVHEQEATALQGNGKRELIYAVRDRLIEEARLYASENPSKPRRKGLLKRFFGRS